MLLMKHWQPLKLISQFLKKSQKIEINDIDISLLKHDPRFHPQIWD